MVEVVFELSLSVILCVISVELCVTKHLLHRVSQRQGEERQMTPGFNEPSWLVFFQPFVIIILPEK